MTDLEALELRIKELELSMAALQTAFESFKRDSMTAFYRNPAPRIDKKK